MEHLISGRMTGASGVATFCVCGRAFFTAFQGSVQGFETDRQRKDAIARADERWRAHIPPPRSRLVTAGQLAQALASAGVLGFDVNDTRRIVIDIGPEYDSPVVMYVELYADERWLDAAVLMDGVNVVTRPQEPG